MSNDIIICIISTIGIIIFYAISSVMFPYSQWTRQMMGRPKPIPYRDIPLEMLKSNFRGIFNNRYIIVVILCSLLHAILAVFANKSIGVYILALILISTPMIILIIVSGRIWRDYIDSNIT